jgi:hypothetical protein
MGGNESTVEQYISYLSISRKPVTQLREKYCTAFVLNLVYP